jgi:hypothetical protein
MKKLVYSLLVTIITVVVIFSCQKDEVKFNDNEQGLNHENVYYFVKKHVEINNKINTVLEKETQFNKEILHKSSSENCTNENEFKVILQQAGIIKFNEISELISLQVKNSKKFQSNNAVFFKLDKVEQYKLLSKYVDETINETLIESNVKIVSKVNSCATQYAKRKRRCNRDVNLYGTYAIISCFSGPWTCALTTSLVMIENKICMDDAREDYPECSN